VAALRDAGVPHRLLAGPWAHAAPETAMPGPRVDLDVEMAAFFDRWLRHDGAGHEDGADLFVRTSTRPQPDLDLHGGYWIREDRPGDRTSWTSLTLDHRDDLAVDPSVGTAAWIDCAGHLPWGLSTDQRADDVRSLTWDLDPPPEAIVGQPRVTLRVGADVPEASLSVKLCDVFPDGTSALITRGSLDLRYRDGVHGAVHPLVPGEEYDVTVELDACAYRLDERHRLRVSVAGADWPNTVAPPTPVSLSIDGGTVELPLWDGAMSPPRLPPGAATSNEDPAGVTWQVTDDVLARTTTCSVHSETTYDVPYGGTSHESYSGSVTVDRRTFAQRADAHTSFRLTWPEVTVRVTSTMTVLVGTESHDVRIEATAYEDDGFGEEQVAHRTWQESVPR
jgi:uncharacterized protein